MENYISAKREAIQLFLCCVFIKENDIAVLNQNGNVKGIDMAVWDTKMANDIAA